MLGLFCLLIDCTGYVSCAYLFLKSLPRTIRPLAWKTAVAFTVYLAVGIFVTVLRNDIISMVTLTGIYLGIGWLCFHRNLVNTLYQFLYSTGYTLCQYITIFIGLILVKNIQISEELAQAGIILLKNSILLLFTAIVILNIKKKYLGTISHNKIYGMIFMPCVSLFILFIYIISAEVFFIRFGYSLFILLCVLLLILDIYCIHVWYDISKNQELKHNIQLMQQQSQMKLHYYEIMEENYQHSRKVIHDMRNHLNLLEQKYHLENSPYVNDLRTLMSEFGMKFYTDNGMLNIILNDKFKAGNIKADCNFGGINLDFLSDLDTTAIFANLLDNAIEAVGILSDESIKIRGQQIHDFIVITVSNPVCMDKCHDIKSSGGHSGLGLSIVQQAVEKNGGEFVNKSKNDMYTVTILFPKGEKNEEKI